jgi:hypothetical protein
MRRQHAVRGLVIPLLATVLLLAAQLSAAAICPLLWHWDP